MNKIKGFISKNKIAVAAVAVILVAVIAVVLVLCLRKPAKQDENNGSTGSTESALNDAKEASVTVRSKGGMTFDGIRVYIYEDSTHEELVDVKRTDSDGRITFKTNGRSGYTVVLEGIPGGYDVKPDYTITDVNTVISLDTVLVKSEDLSKEKFSAGDIMKDFTVKATDGTEYTLSGLLKDKDAVVLNFWYLTCVPCKEEFPLLEEAYRKNKDDIAVIAMNPINKDESEISEYADKMGLTFPVVSCDEAFASAFGVTTYPTTVIIDRYGMISFIRYQAIDAKETFERIFDYYKDDKYVQSVVKNIEDIVTPGSTEHTTADENNTTDNETTEDQTTETEPGTETTDDSKITYSVTVTDENGDGVPETVVKIGDEYFSTDKKGTVKVELEPGVYSVAVTSPQGYAPVSEVYSLTEENKEIKIVLATLKREVYTVTVVEENGSAMKGVEVFVGNEKAFTDASGKAVFSLTDGNYKATVVAPEGYTADSFSQEFGASKEVKFSLKKGETEVTDGITYTVNVKDYFGNPVSGAAVSFIADGTVKHVANTDSSGKAEAVLKKGDYTFEIAVDGKYEKNLAKLSPSKTTADIQIAKIAQKTQEIWSVPRYEVLPGGTYVPVEKLTGDEYCYVVFHPERSGLYRVSVSDNGTKLSEHSSTVLSLITENLRDNVITLNVKESYLSPYTQFVFGLTGSEDCIVTITRIGDEVLDESDYEYIIYKGKHKPSAFKYQGNDNLTYFDVSASSELKLTDIVLGSDGFYHYDSATGPVIYVDFNNKKLPLIEMIIGSGNVGGSGFRVYVYNENGDFVKKEDYTDCLTEYIDCIDTNKKLYPLTEDLRYILEFGGKAIGWYDDGPNKLSAFGSKIINVKTAWLFICCYDK